MLPETLGLGFIIGLTGAVPPGPMLVAVINGALRYGWRAGPLAVVGHAAVELVIFVIIALGLTGAAAAHALARPIGMVGGCVLIGFGALTLRGLRHDSPANCPPVPCALLSCRCFTRARSSLSPPPT